MEWIPPVLVLLGVVVVGAPVGLYLGGGLDAIADTLLLPRHEAAGIGRLSDRARERAPSGRALVLGVWEAR
jgi:hypothetical protein